MDNSENYQIERIEEYRHRKVFSFFSFIVVYGVEIEFIWTGKWFKWINITEQKIKERWLKFDDGWSYEFYWSKWKDKWKFLKLD